jgi:hypothetical protein
VVDLFSFHFDVVLSVNNIKNADPIAHIEADMIDLAKSVLIVAVANISPMIKTWLDLSIVFSGLFFVFEIDILNIIENPPAMHAMRRSVVAM